MPLGEGWGTGEGAAASVPRGRRAMNESTAPRAPTRGVLFRNDHLEGGESDLPPSVSFPRSLGPRSHHRLVPLAHAKASTVGRRHVLPASGPRRGRPLSRQESLEGARGSQIKWDGAAETDRDTEAVVRAASHGGGAEGHTNTTINFQRSLKFDSFRGIPPSDLPNFARGTEHAHDNQLYCREVSNSLPDYQIIQLTREADKLVYN